MTSWSTIFPDLDGPPVRGEPDEFVAAHDRFDAMATDAQAVVDCFAQLADIGSHPDRLQGPFTAPLSTAFSDVDEGLQVLPRIAGEAAAIFSSHRQALAPLRDEADAELERAVAAWNRKNELEASAAQLEAAMPSLFGVPPDEMEATAVKRRSLGSRLDSVNGSIDDQDAILAAVRESWAGLREAEDDRDSTTGDDLGDIDLGPLKDPGFWDRVCNAVGDFLSAVGEWAVDALGAVVDAMAGLVQILQAAWDRFSTYLQYLAQSGLRRLRNPLQTLWDLGTGTLITEEIAAAQAILIQDGELYNEGPYCGEEASCIVGVAVPPGADAMTIGHTIMVADPNPPAWGTDDAWDSLVAHEMQHVYDFESVGALAFGVTYFGHYGWNRVVLGQNHDDAYENIWWERRAYAVSRGEREPQGLWADVWDTATTALDDLPPPALPVPHPPVIPGPWSPFPVPLPLPIPVPLVR